MCASLVRAIGKRVALCLSSSETAMGATGLTWINPRGMTNASLGRVHCVLPVNVSAVSMAVEEDRDRPIRDAL